MTTISKIKVHFRHIKHTVILIAVCFAFQTNAFSQLSLNWKEISNIHNSEDFHAYKAVTVHNGDSLTAYYTITNVINGNLVFFPAYSAQNKKPEKYLEESGNEVIALTNSGYFGTNVSYSLLINNYNLYASNTKALSRTYDGVKRYYYPTRSAFGIDAKLRCEGTYVYTLNTDNITYSYPEPSPNTTANPPLQKPTADYPLNGTLWAVSDAVGGGPLLIKDGQQIADYTPELFPVDITASIAPRTAIGKTADGDIINLVVDGRQTHSKGVSLETLSDILLDLGCTDAMNLDGGGSSCLFIDNKLINQPSDGSTRSIPTVITIKKAHKFYADSSQHFIRSTPASDSNNITAFQYTKSLEWKDETAGGFILNLTDPAAYRIEYVVPEILPENLTETINFSLHQGKESTIDFSLSTSDLSTNQFAHLGSFQLGKSDTLFLSNSMANSSLPICGLRLVKSGSGLPSISLNPASYSGIYSYNESLKLTFQAEANNMARELCGYAIYEFGENGQRLIRKEEFDPKSTYHDSLEYTVNQYIGQVKLVFAVFDEEKDSVAVSYAINLDDSPPSVALGKNSVLQAGLMDSLKFELKVLPANDGRLLDELIIWKNPGSNETLLGSFYPRETGDTIIYKYKISRDDVPGINFRFTIVDQAGYSSYRDYALAVNDIANRSIQAKLYFDNSLKQLHIIAKEIVEQEMILDIISIDGRVLMSKSLLANTNHHIDANYLLPGTYISRLTYGGSIKVQKFIVSE